MKLTEIRKKFNKKVQGSVGVGHAIAFFAEQGIPVFTQVSDICKYDLVVDIDGELKRVEVKTTSAKNPHNSWVVQLRTNGGNQSGRGKTRQFDENSVDYLFVLTESMERYLIPSKDVIGRNSVSLPGKYLKYKV